MASLSDIRLKEFMPTGMSGLPRFIHYLITIKILSTIPVLSGKVTLYAVFSLKVIVFMLYSSYYSIIVVSENGK